MKKTHIYILFLALFAVAFTSSNAWAADIYVDPSLANTCTSGNYSISNRDCSGSDGNAYTTVQSAIDAMNGGDDIYLRGGTYGPSQLTGSSTAGDVTIPPSKDGTSSNWSSIQSYPGEWAVLDGANRCGSRGGVIGFRDWDKDGSTDLKYWKFERLEITNGTSDDGSATSGIWVNGGPFIVRYCYIHNNVADTGGANPAGIKGMIWHDSIIEYTYFKDNGTDASEYEQHAAAGPQIHTDYRHTKEYFETAPYDINHALTKNKIRYNLFDNTNKYAYSGIHNKGRQWLTPKTNVDWTYKNYGDKVHHNIFIGFPRAIGAQQDFQQVYNNIVDTPAVNSADIGIIVTDPGLSSNNVGVAVYNNTIQGGRLTWNFSNGTYPDDYVVNPYLYAYNNLIDDAPSDYDNSGVINLGYNWMMTTFDYEAARTDITNNYLYRPNSTNFRILRNPGDCYSTISMNQYDSCYSETNYSKASSEGTENIYAGSTGADQYISRGTHTIEEGVTIANGGAGGQHPYLPDVTIPSYVGATNPNDNEWVEGVLGLRNLNNLKNGKQFDPVWVEGVSGSNDKLQAPPQIWFGTDSGS